MPAELRTPQGKQVANIGQRIASRAIDGAALLPLFMLLVGLEAVVRAATGVEAAEGSSDWVSTMLGFLSLIIIVSYDAVTSAILKGATPGKKATHRRVVRWEDGGPSSLAVLLARNALLVLEWSCIAPGIADLVLTGKRDDGRTWVDRATGTAVINDREPAAAMPVPVPAFVPVARTSRPEPWGSLVAAAGEARARLARTVTPVPVGPLRERLDEVTVRVAACEVECIRVADRGLGLTDAVAGTDLIALRSRYEAVAADPAKAALVDAYARELGSAERLTALVESTTIRLQQLVSELNSAANTGIEIALSPSNDKTFELLLDQLDGLRASLEVVEAEAGPTAI